MWSKDSDSPAYSLEIRCDGFSLAWSPKGIRIDDRIGAPQIPFIAWLGFFPLLSTSIYFALVNWLIFMMALFT